jgi:spore coat protein CotH
MQINYIKKLSLILITFLLVNCNEDTVLEPIIEGTEITSFSFLKEKNPSLSFDIYLEINNNVISGSLPYNANIESLIATFEHDGFKVYSTNTEQISGVTSNDFSKNIDYTVKTTDGREEKYEIHITYFTGLPIVYIDTNGFPIDSKEEYRDGFTSVYGSSNFMNIPNSEMEIRGRGNSTWYFHPKKAYQLKFSDKTEMLDMPKDKKWIFLAEHSDKTLLRNKIAFEMGYISKLDWTPQSVFSEVFINNEYNGTYHITQKVEESDNRVVLGDTGYLLEIDQLERMKDDDVYFYTSEFLINIKEPEVAYDSEEFNYAKNLINEFETVLKGSKFNDPEDGYIKYIDLDSFIDWYLISEITKNQDSRSWSSIFLNVVPGEKIKMGPLWDFDLAFGNVNYSECEFPEGFWVKDNAWYHRLFQDPVFVSRVKNRFLYFKRNQDLILGKIDFYAAYLHLAQNENNEKWNVLGEWIWPNPIVFDTYEEEVAHLKNWYVKRMNWLDTAFKNL